jgi:NADPH:quinone reductase-like Zn-dependent oxidoreductase
MEHSGSNGTTQSFFYDSQTGGSIKLVSQNANNRVKRNIMAREGIHPETPAVPFMPGWDLVGVVDRLGDGVSEFELGQRIAAMPIHGAYAEFVCLPQRELVPVPSGLDAIEVVSLVLNYITAYRCYIVLPR